MTEYVTQNIRTVLKTYQSSATKSLQGPGQSLVAAAAVAAGAVSPPTIIKKEILSSPEPLDVNESPTLVVQPPPPPELPQPILTVADTGRGELYETRLEGKTIGCFSLGGELRLCLPQFLNNVLAEFTLDQINRIFDELGIFCSQCTPDQLMEFKAAKILPPDVKASGLITRTDAERLCAALLHRSADRHQYAVDDIPKGAISFKVYHRCFGKCEGICTPDMYSYMKPACIMCIECKGWLSPQKFVGHVHRRQENRTCHWGFDSRNWHDYLHVALDVENREKYTKMLDELKELERKETRKAQRDLSYLKRKAELEEVTIPAPPCKREPIDIPTKKVKSLDETPAYQLDYQRYQQALIYHCAAQQQQQRGQISAFRPWAPKAFLPLTYNSVPLPYLSQEPPVLQNPERVVRNTESERFERTYQPNVALAPRKVILSKEREKERERERDLDRQQTQHAAITNLCEAELHIKQERPTSPDDLAQSPEDIRMPSPSPHNNNNNNNNNNTNKSNNNNLNNNRRHSMHSPPPPPSSSQLHLRHLHHTPPQSLSPEEFSGSNEITSSTSPIPNNHPNTNSTTSPNNIQQHLQHLHLQQSFHQHHAAAAAAAAHQHRIHHQHPHPHQHHQQHQQSPHHHPHQSQSIIATVNQHSKLLTTADNNNILCLPSRIRISKNLINQSNIVRSPTPPPLPPSTVNHEQYLASNKRQQPHHHHHMQQQSPSQSSASLSSNSLSAQATAAAAVNLVTTGNVAANDATAAAAVAASVAAGVLVKHHAHLNGGGVGIVGNSEFELSTDTDDDSLNGEPDSQSNIPSPWELAADALKDTRPKDREKILQLLQKLLHDNKKMRCDCIQLIEEVRKRDEQICDLQQELQHYRRQVALLSPVIAHQKVNSSCSNSSTSSSTSSSSACSNGSVIAKIDSCSTSQNESTIVPGAAPIAPSSSTSSALSSSYQQESQPTKNETEKIKVPLKKSSRRSPEETVVVLNQTSTIGTSSTANSNGDDATQSSTIAAAAEINVESKQMPNLVNTSNVETPPKSTSPPIAPASSAALPPHQSTAPTSSTSPTSDSADNAATTNDESHTNTKQSGSSLAPSPTSPSSSSSSSSVTSLSSASSSPTSPPSSGTAIKTEK